MFTSQIYVLFEIKKACNEAGFFVAPCIVWCQVRYAAILLEYAGVKASVLPFNAAKISASHPLLSKPVGPYYYVSCIFALSHYRYLHTWRKVILKELALYKYIQLEWLRHPFTILYSRSRRESNSGADRFSKSINNSDNSKVQ